MLFRVVGSCCVWMFASMHPHLRAGRLWLDNFTGCEAGQMMDRKDAEVAAPQVIAAAV